MLSEKEKEEALKIARWTLESYLQQRMIPSFDSVSENLQKPGGAFVTLHRGKMLRGCIGRFDSPDPLYQTIQQMALASALEDPRFVPLAASELPELHIEISVLSPRRTIREVAEIEVGTHGLCVSRGQYRGVLLPQVAIEYNWSREEFLSQTCLKATLPPDAWEDEDVKIEVFTAEVFGEKS